MACRRDSGVRPPNPRLSDPLWFTRDEPSLADFRALRKRMGVCEDASFTYFAWGQRTHLIKIGRSFRPSQRMREISLETAQTVELVASFRGDIEAFYHNHFRDHRRHGEWFDPHQDILAEIDRLNMREEPEIPCRI